MGKLVGKINLGVKGWKTPGARPETANNHPWGGDPTDIMKYPIVNILNRLRPFLYTAVISVLVVMLLILPLSANDEKVEELKGLVDEIYEELDDESRDFADEYIDILQDLEDIIDDYGDYFDEFSESDRKYLRENNLSFGKISRKLNRGKYLSNPDDLNIDISSMIELLEHLHGSHNHNLICNERCKLFRNLDRELSILSRHIVLYMSIQTRQNLRHEKIRVYLETHLSEVVNQALEAAQLGLDVAPVTRIEIDIAEISSVPFATITRNTPDIPKIIIRAPSRMNSYEIVPGTQRRYVDSITVSSDNREIFISNPMGNIRVTGWDNSTISASLQVEVASRLSKREKEFLDATELMVSKTEKGYEILADFPTLDDTRTKLVGSFLVVQVPKNNFTITRNSFGEISMSDINGGVKISSRHSEINIDNISGGAYIENSMGVVRLTDVEGNINIACSYGEIEITNCRSNMRLESHYSDIRIFDCSGSGRLSGSGNVYVQGFIGTLDISNSYGTVEIRDVDGDLDATNAYYALIVRDISGTAVLENSFSRVDVYKVGGAVSVSNTHGPIFAEALNGPMDLENEKGSIKIILDRKMSGISRILNNGGSIDLSFLRRGNFVVTATVFDGEINSHLPLHISKEGNKKTASLSFGRGLDSLVLLARGSDINISESN